MVKLNSTKEKSSGKKANTSEKILPGKKQTRTDGSRATAETERPFGDPSTFSTDDLKLVLSFSGGLAVINSDLFSEHDKMRQKSHKATLTKNSTEVCPPLESRKYFFPFEKLPTELRDEIWKQYLGAVEPRIIKVYYNDKIKRKPIRSKTGAPVILHICPEARAVGLKVYKELVINDYFTGTFIDWERDLIYISSDKCMRSLMALPEMMSDSAELNKMCRRLAIDEHGLWTFVSDFKPKVHFPMVEELIKVSLPSVLWGGTKQPGRQAASLEKVQHRHYFLERAATAPLRFFQRQKNPSIAKVGHQCPVPFPHLVGKQKAAKKEQDQNDAICDAVMLAAYKLQTSIQSV